MKRIIILIISGPMKGEKYIVETESPVLIGRNQRAAINISNDLSVSRKHALIYWRDRDCYIKDLESTNGIYIEGEKTDRETPINDGSIVQLGKTICIVKIENIKTETK